MTREIHRPGAGPPRVRGLARAAPCLPGWACAGGRARLAAHRVRVAICPCPNPLLKLSMLLVRRHGHAKSTAACAWLSADLIACEGAAAGW